MAHTPNATRITDSRQYDTETFLTALYGLLPDGWLEIAYIPPKGLNLFIHFDWVPLPLTIRDNSFKRLHQQNGMGYGVYIGMAARQKRKDKGRGGEADARYIPALWCDIDNIEPENGYYRLIGMPIPPSLIIASGGGVHGYWPLAQPVIVGEDSTRWVKRTLHGIARSLEIADDKVRDLARVMRLPGFINTKRKQPCRIIDNTFAYYHYGEMQDAYDRYAPREAPVMRREIPMHAANSEMPRWVQSYLSERTAEGERNNRAFAAAVELLDCGWSPGQVEQVIRLKALADGLEEAEVVALLRSAEKRPRQPVIDRNLSARYAARDAALRNRGGAE